MLMKNFEFSNFDTVELAQKYGTPLYVMSQDILEDRVNKLKRGFEETGIDYYISFASKSFINKGLCRIIDSLGIGLDTASGGELYTALAAGFNPEKITLHGSNKSEEEIRLALENDIGKIVVDSETELYRIQKLAEELDKTVNIMVRINPGVDAHTNELINTGKTDTKFGIPIEQAVEVLKKIKDLDRLNLIGLHSHIGSQIITEKPFIEASRKMLELYKNLKEHGFSDLKELNLGGGFGIAYTKDEVTFDPENYIPKLVNQLTDLSNTLGIELPVIAIEPGRFISAEAGITLYTIGTVKELPDLRTYVSVDGGMADNPRPALYGADYEAVICNRALTPENGKAVRVSGKACETDTLIKNIELADPQEGDILAILRTGAYNYTMASNYNRLPKPAVVLLKGDRSEILCERETYEDILRNDRIPSWLE